MRITQRFWIFLILSVFVAVMMPQSGFSASAVKGTNTIDGSLLGAGFGAGISTGDDKAPAKPAKNQAKGIEGIWEGTLSVNGAKLRVVFHISKGDGSLLTATLDSPDQGATNIPVSSVTFENGKLVVDIEVAMAVFEGSVNGDFSAIEGNWKQSGMTLPLKLARVKEAPKMRRPQEPKKPYPYKEKEVTIENKEGGVKLAGTLTLPSGKPPFPAVVLISGSGPEDRNETVFGHRPFLVLADYLTRRGIAVLRVDDRGVGGSTGDLWSSTSKDFAGDVAAEVNYLMSRKDIDSERIGLIGHSEGGIIAPMVAVRMKRIAFIVLMAGTGVPGDSILYRQSELIAKAEGVDEEKIAQNRALQEKIFSIIKNTKDQDTARAKLEAVFADVYSGLSEKEKASMPDSTKFIESQVSQAGNVLTPWFRYFISYDPAAMLKKVECPVLAIGGGKDLQVPADENLKAIGDALKTGGNKDFTVKELPDLNHLFQKAETGDVSEYSKIEETISPAALKLIGDWIEKHISHD